MSATKLYHCPPLQARIRQETCANNKAHASLLAAGEVVPRDRSEAAYQLLEAQRLRIRHCVDCPGVLALSRRGAKPPTLAPSLREQLEAHR